jgi:hypothetical protein
MKLNKLADDKYVEPCKSIIQIKPSHNRLQSNVNGLKNTNALRLSGIARDISF